MFRLLSVICFVMCFVAILVLPASGQDMCDVLNDQVAGKILVWAEDNSVQLEFSGAIFGPCGGGPVWYQDSQTTVKGDYHFSPDGLVDVRLFGQQFLFLYLEGDLMLLPNDPPIFTPATGGNLQ
jgi:hypothetical protein